MYALCLCFAVHNMPAYVSRVLSFPLICLLPCGVFYKFQNFLVGHPLASLIFQLVTSKSIFFLTTDGFHKHICICVCVCVLVSFLVDGQHRQRDLEDLGGG